MEKTRNTGWLCKLVLTVAVATGITYGNGVAVKSATQVMEVDRVVSAVNAIGSKSTTVQSAMKSFTNSANKTAIESVLNLAAKGTIGASEVELVRGIVKAQGVVGAKAESITFQALVKAGRTGDISADSVLPEVQQIVSNDAAPKARTTVAGNAATTTNEGEITPTEVEELYAQVVAANPAVETARLKHDSSTFKENVALVKKGADLGCKADASICTLNAKLAPSFALAGNNIPGNRRAAKVAHSIGLDAMGGFHNRTALVTGAEGLYARSAQDANFLLQDSQKQVSVCINP